MGKFTFLIAFILAFFTAGYGQVSGYTFSQSTGNTYTEITGGTVVVTCTDCTDSHDGSSWVITLPTPVYFNGAMVTSVVMRSDGSLIMGSTSTSSSTGPIAATTTATGGIISPLGMDLRTSTVPGTTYETRWEDTGSSYVFQWKNASRWNQNTIEKLNFQVRINKTTGAVTMAYGDMIVAANTTYQPQVGLRGTTNSDYNNRRLSDTFPDGSPSWEDTGAGTSNSHNLRFTSGAPAAFPASGLNYVWTPPACVPPILLTSSNIGGTTATIQWQNPFSAPASGYDYYVSTSSTAPTASTTPTGNVASGTTLNLTLLAPTTQHYVFLRANCGGTTSVWTSAVTFITTQIPGTVPFNDGFEGTNNWNIVNGTQTNKFFVSNFVNNGGANSLYVSNNASGTNNDYSNTTSTVHAYRDITIPVGATDLVLSFDWRAGGESTLDFLRVWVVPTTFIPAAGTQISVGNSGGIMIADNLQGSGTFTTSAFSIAASAYAGQTVRLVFQWRNNASVNAQPAGAIDNVNIVAPTCYTPGGLMATNAPGATTLSWTAATNGSPATGYDVYVSETNVAPTGATTPTSSVTALNTTLTTLTSDVVYYYWVRSNCGAGDTSVWVSGGSFRAECPAVIPPTVLETFTDYTGLMPAPACWREMTGALGAVPAALTGTSSTWANSNFNNITGHENGTAAMINLYGADNDWIISPAINLGTGAVTYQLEFTASIVPWSGTATVTDMGEKTGKVVISTDGGLTWSDANVLRTYSNSNIPANGVNEYISLAGYTGIVKIGFHAFSTTTTQDLRFYIDNFRVIETPACLIPLTPAITASSIGENTATVTWSAPSIPPTGGYQYYVSTTDTDPTASTPATGTVGAGILSANIVSLTASTTYYVWVRSDCGGGSYSEWTSAVSFKTLCDSPDLLSTAGATICGHGPAILNATASGGAIKWYAAATGGFALATGNSFTTPSINTTTTYYVSAENSGTPLAGGKLGPESSWSGSTLTDWGIVFNALQDITLNSVDVYSTAAGTLVVSIENASGTELFATGTINVAAGGVTTPTTIPLNFPVSAGTGYRILVKSYTGVSLVRGSSNLAFPYTNDNISVTASEWGGTTTGTYYYFYNINTVTTCASTRIPVVATVNPAPALTLSANTAAICAGETTAAITLTAGATDYDTYTWTPSAGVTGSAATGWTFNPAATTTYTLNASQSTGAMCAANAATVTVTVNPLPSVLSIATPATACLDSVATLTATGGNIPATGTIGTGTTITGNTEELTAFSNRRISYKMQMIYTAAELQAAGLQAGNITSIAFNISTIGDAATNDDYTVKIGTTTNAAFPNTTYLSETAFTTVYGPSTYTHAIGWNVIPFSTPFVWDGTSNIVVSVTHLGADDLYNAETYYTNMSTNTTLFSYNNLTVASSTKRFNATFTGEAQGAITWAPAANLYTDAAATTAYVAGTNAATVYAKSNTAATTTYTATATSVAGCTRTQTVDVTVVNCAIDFANLQSPATASIYTCNSQAVTGQVLKTGVTEAAGQATGMKAWVGVSTANTDPSTWTEAEWHVATFSTQAGNNDEYTYTIAGLPAGTYYYATRYQYLTGAYVYGGLSGFWNGTTSTSGTLTVNAVAAPATTNATFCNATPTIADLAANATGTALKWYAAETGGTELASTTALTAGTYYVSQTVSGCEGPRASVVVTLNTTAAPATTNATFCNAAPTVADLAANATGTALKWYAAETGGTELASTTALVAGNYYVSQTINGCEGPRGTVVVTLNTTAAPVTTTATFCNAAPTVADLAANATGTALKWYAAETGGTELASTIALVAGNYYVSQTINGCESARATVAVILNTTAAPATTNATFCNATPTVADLAANATGTALKWYAAETGGTELASTTALVAGNYYVSQTINGCESARATVVVTLNTTVAPTVTDLTFCNAAPTVADIIAAATGTDVKVYAAATGGTELATTSALVAGDYFVSQTVNGCEGPREEITVTLNTTVAPTAPVAQTFCPGATVANIEVTTGTAIQWYSTLTGDTPIAATTVLTNGAIYYMSQTINGCESTRTGVTATITTVAVDDIADQVVACGTYTLPALTNGNYFDGANGTGTAYDAGDIISSDMTMFIFNQIGECSAETSFTIDVNVIAAPGGEAIQTVEVTNPADATVADLEVTVTGTLTWYATEADALAGENALSADTQLVSGEDYFAVQTIGTCSSLPFEVTVTVALGRNDFAIQNIKVYPNPVVEKLVISYSSNITLVEVYDLLGKRVIVEQPNTTTAEINMGRLEAATYIVKVTADGMTKDVKVVKRN